MKNYFLVAVRLNMTKEEINQLSAETTKRMFDEMHLEELKQQAIPKSDTLSYNQIFSETKIAFPFLDTIYNGWLTLRDSSAAIDTLPIFFYRPVRNINKSQTQQLYNYLLTRFNKDSAVIINTKTIPAVK